MSKEKKPVPQAPRQMPERKPSHYDGAMPGIDRGYTRHDCDAPKGHPGFLGSKNKGGK